MSRIRGSLGVLVSTAAILWAMAWLPAVAHAATHIVIKYVNIGLCALQVEVNDGNGLQLTSMTVHFYLGTKDVYDATDMAYASGPATDQVWNATDPISKAHLAPGTYTLKVDAADADESDLGLPSPESIGIGYSTTVTAGAAPSTLGYGDLGTTISGTVLGLKSCDTMSVGMPAVPIDLVDEIKGTIVQIATTKSDGSFSAQVNLPRLGDIYRIDAASGPTWQGSSIVLQFNWAMEQTKLVSVKVTPQDAPYGGTETLTGTALVDNVALGWVPLAAFPIWVRAGQAGRCSFCIKTTAKATVETSSAGQFTWTYSASDGTRWRAQIADISQYLYLSLNYGSIHVAVPLRFSALAVWLSPFAQLKVHTCLKVTVPNFSVPTRRVDIQYAPGRSGPWKTLGRLSIQPASYARACGSRPFIAPLASAFYRASIGATPDNQAASSTPVLRWKGVTRFAFVHVSPRTVPRGGNLTVSGHLQSYNRRWRNFARQRVLIIFRPPGSKVWYWIRKVTTNSSGYFTSTFPDSATADWSAEYEGDATHFASIGSVHHVKVPGPSSALQPFWRLLS